MENKLHISVSPHIHSKRSTQKIMLDVLLALLPVTIAGVVIFGITSLAVIAVCVGVAVLSEFLFNLIVKKLQIQIKNKNINTHLNIPDDLNIMFDRDGFEQILLNIAGNAVKYTSDNGNVWIDAKRKNNNIEINIRDDGQGIPKQDQARIFERFYRVDKARARGLGGTGLGLSIAKQIAEAHNCTITVNSEINKGTEMIITIPE